MQKQISLLGIFILLFGVAPCAMAQDHELEPELHGLTFAHTTPREDAPAAKQHRILPLATPQTSNPPEDSMSPEQKIWEKYKALAAGEAKQEPQQTDGSGQQEKTLHINAPGRPTPPASPLSGGQSAQTAQAQKGPTGSGMSSVLEQWQANKTEQRDMRSKSFPVPDALKSFQVKPKQ